MSDLSTVKPGDRVVVEYEGQRTMSTVLRCTDTHVFTASGWAYEVSAGACSQFRREWARPATDAEVAVDRAREKLLRAMGKLQEWSMGVAPVPSVTDHEKLERARTLIEEATNELEGVCSRK